jgi:hypothetical protein
MVEAQDPEYKAVFTAGSRTKAMSFRSKWYAQEYLLRRAREHLHTSTWLHVDNWDLVLLVRLDTKKVIYRRVERRDDGSKL